MNQFYLMHPRQAMMVEPRTETFTALSDGSEIKFLTTNLTLNFNSMEQRTVQRDKEQEREWYGDMRRQEREHRRDMGLTYKRLRDLANIHMGIERKGPDPRTKKSKSRLEKERRIAKYYGMK